MNRKLTVLAVILIVGNIVLLSGVALFRGIFTQDSAVIVSEIHAPLTAKDRLIDINTAPIEELNSLDGISDVISGRIIEYRKQTPFLKIEDIQNVKGIGEKTFAKIKGKITVK